MQKEKILSLLKENPKRVVLILMAISVSLMLISENNILIVFAAIFTFLYFAIWLRENIRAFLKWIQKVKGEFAIFGEYADRFTNLFFKQKEGKR